MGTDVRLNELAATVELSVEVNGHSVQGIVTGPLLVARYDASVQPGSWLSVYRRNASAIDAEIRERYLAYRTQPVVIDLPPKAAQPTG